VQRASIRKTGSGQCCSDAMTLQKSAIWMGALRRGASQLTITLVITLLVIGGCGTSKRGTRSPPSSVTRGPMTTIPRPTTTTTTANVATTSTTAMTTTSTTVVPTGPAVVIRQGDEHRRWIALTFDAGSDVGNTSAILDLLAARHVRATFSLTGIWARANPDLVRRIARAGHVIVNHTDTHRSFTGFSTHTSALSAEQRATQLEGADTSIAAITGSSTRPWFRPPYGDIDAAAPVDVARAGYRYVLLWTVDSLGWKGLAPADVVTRCLNGATPGAILLFHVGSASTDSAALPLILDGLRARRYELVTVAATGFVAS
jgi:peptidoglycan/xylan/chitin deacetylase (PgdA/CDA1 family)